MSEIQPRPGPLDAVGTLDAVDEAAHRRAAVRGAQYTGSRLFVALSAMAFGGAVFAYFFLRSLDGNGLWRAAGQRPSPFISVPVLVFSLLGCALFIWSSGRLGRSVNAANDWRVSSIAALLLLIGSAALQFWGLSRLPFFPGSSGYASVYVATAPLFATWVLLAAVWVEILVARSLRVRWITAPVGENADTMDAVSFAGSLAGARLLLGFIAMVSVVFYVLFSVIH